MYGTPVYSEKKVIIVSRKIFNRGTKDVIRELHLQFLMRIKFPPFDSVSFSTNVFNRVFGVTNIKTSGNNKVLLIKYNYNYLELNGV